MLVKKAQIEKSDNQAMCTYLQSEQRYSIDPLNLLNTLRGMFSQFFVIPVVACVTLCHA